MALKYELESLDGLDKTVASEYREENGKYFLDVEGVVPKARHDEFRNNNIELNNKLTDLQKQFEGVDPKKHQELMQLEADYKSGKLKGDDVDVEKLVSERASTIAAQFEGEITGLKDTLSTTQKQLEVLLVDSEVNRAAVQSGVLPSAATDVVLRAKSAFKVENGKAVPYKDGNPVYSRDGVTPMSVSDWIIDLKKSAPHLFEGNKGGGSSGNGSNGTRDRSDMSASEKIAAGLSQRN